MMYNRYVRTFICPCTLIRHGGCLACHPTPEPPLLTYGIKSLSTISAPLASRSSITPPIATLHCQTALFIVSAIVQMPEWLSGVSPSPGSLSRTLLAVEHDWIQWHEWLTWNMNLGNHPHCLPVGWSASWNLGTKMPYGSRAWQVATRGPYIHSLHPARTHNSPQHPNKLGGCTGPSHLVSIQWQAIEQRFRRAFASSCCRCFAVPCLRYLTDQVLAS